MKNTACIVTLGCKANQFESAAMEQQLRDCGYQLCRFEQGAQLVVVNTCTVTAATDSQSRKLVRRARRLNPECKILVTGCYAQINPQLLAALPGVTLVFGNMEKQNFRDLLLGIEGQFKNVQVGDISQARTCPELEISFFAEHSRAFVQIQSGCDAFCSYCIIPYARGRSRSVAMECVIAQIRKLVDNGYHEIVLTGIHIGNYGRDFTTPASLAQLVKAILKHTSLHRLRLGSVEPMELTDELIAVIADNKRVCPHLHIPLQSGSDTVLKRMNRHYTADQFSQCLNKLESMVKDIAIGVDLITGFPAETDEEHLDTVALINKLPISFVHVFPYSKRAGTTAATMDIQIQSRLAKLRAAQLRSAGEKKQHQYMRQHIGKKLEVVVENRHYDHKWRGVSAEYLPIMLTCKQNVAGACLMVQVVDMAKDGSCLMAVVADDH